MKDVFIVFVTAISWVRSEAEPHCLRATIGDNFAKIIHSLYFIITGLWSYSALGKQFPNWPYHLWSYDSYPSDMNPPGGSKYILSVGDYVDNSFTALGSSDPREVRLELLLGFFVFHLDLIKSILFFVNWISLHFFHVLYNITTLCLLILFPPGSSG